MRVLDPLRLVLIGLAIRSSPRKMHCFCRESHSVQKMIDYIPA